MPIISISSLFKIYNAGENEVRALDGVDLTINAGEFTAIVGPSGSGKTTLLNMLGGLDSPTSGKIIIGDTEITKLDENQLINFRRDNVGFVFQSYNLIPVLTAKENVAFVMNLQGLKKEYSDKRAMELLEDVGLKGREDDRPSKLSGGQQQRVAVARALAAKPRFILADEPTANLDSKSAETLLDIMQELNKKEGITFLFSTHDPRVMARATRVITIEDGKIK